MNSLRSTLLSALMVVVGFATARAMDMNEMGSNRIVSIGLGGGVSVPVSDARDAFKTGFNGQGFVRLNLRMLPVAPRLDFTFSHFNLDDAKVGNTGTGQVLAGIANLQLFLLQGGPVRPYVVAGLGAYNVKTEVDNTNVGDVSDTRFGVNGGAGVILKFGSLFSAYAEGRVDNVFTDKGGLVAADQIQVVPVTFGVRHVRQGAVGARGRARRSGRLRGGAPRRGLALRRGRARGRRGAGGRRTGRLRGGRGNGRRLRHGVGAGRPRGSGGARRSGGA